MAERIAAHDQKRAELVAAIERAKQAHEAAGDKVCGPGRTPPAVWRELADAQQALAEAFHDAYVQYGLLDPLYAGLSYAHVALSSEALRHREYADEKERRETRR